MSIILKTKQRKKIRFLGKILFVLYIGFILYFLLLTEIYGRTELRDDYAYNLVLFKEIKRFWEYREALGFYVVFANLVGNVLIFIPFGFFMPMGSKYRNFFATLSYSFLLSLCVEVFQLITRVGSFDVDDLFLNTLGGCIGYIVFSICCSIRRRNVIKKT